MADIATVWDPEACAGDWRLASPDVDVLLDESGMPLLSEADDTLLGEALLAAYVPGLISGHDIETAVLISLFTDRQAGPDDVIPDGTDDPRGWWGDLGRTYPIGSKIWLRLRSKRTEQTRMLVDGDIREALQWLVDDGVAASIDVAVEWDGPGFLAALVTVNQASGVTRALRYAWAWKDIG